MVDLRPIYQAYLTEAVSLQKQLFQIKDERAVRSIRNRELDLHIRANYITDWLDDYEVFKGFGDDQIASIGRLIVEFANSYPEDLRLETELSIFEKFLELYSLCADRAPRARGNKLRNVTSLTSKALWACFPKYIPIYDKNVRISLFVLSKIKPASRPRVRNRYQKFLRVWLELREEFTISADQLDGYPYEVRIFDKILWLIGEGKYGLRPD